VVAAAGGRARLHARLERHRAGIGRFEAAQLCEDEAEQSAQWLVDRADAPLERVLHRVPKLGRLRAREECLVDVSVVDAAAGAAAAAHLRALVHDGQD
jgi:hypothetical protein